MIHNPHDKLFKAIFGEPANAVSHFEVSLPPELVAALDLSKARHVPGSWVDGALRDHHSDVLYAVPLRSTDAPTGSPSAPSAEPPSENPVEPSSGRSGESLAEVLLYAIWEHQSTVVQLMALKALRYTTRALDDWSREHRLSRLPPVITMVLYHGESEWTAPQELEELFALEGIEGEARAALRPYLPKLRYLLEVVPEDPAEIRSGPGIARLTLLALKLGRSTELVTLIGEWTEDLKVELAKGALGLQHLGMLVQYLLMVNPVVTPEALSEALRPMGQEAQELPKTWGMRAYEEGMEKGMEKGMEEGMEKGRTQEKVEMARRALGKGMAPVDVAELTGLPFETVLKLTH